MLLRLPSKTLSVRASRTGARAICATLAIAVATISAPIAGLSPKAGANALDRLDQPSIALREPHKAPLQTVIRNGERLIAVGQRGVVIYSDDEGATWTQASTPVKVALTSIVARPDGVAIAVGHDAAILRSTDNGATWRRVADGRDLLPLMIKDMEERYAKAKAVFDKQQEKRAAEEAAAAAAAETADAEAPSEPFADAEAPAAVDEAPVAAADDAADDAADEPVLDEFALEDLDFRVDTMKQSMEFGPAWPFLDVVFLGSDPKENRLLALGAFGMAFRSDDAGETWRLVSDRFTNETDLHLNNAFVTQSGAVLVGSEQGFIFRAENADARFEPLETFDGFSFFEMTMVPGTNKIVAYGFGDTYHFSQDDGASWTSGPLSESMSLAGNVPLPSGGLGIMGDGGQMFEIGPEGEKRRFRPIDTRQMLGDAIPISGSRILFVSEIGVTIADKL